MTTSERPRAVVFSVDLEPNKDGSLDGVRDAMEWFDRTAPRGTVFGTYRIATELPELLSELSASFEIGVHVHPREFGHEHDQLAELPRERQRELITETRTAVGDAIGSQPEAITSFRAGRHSASETTLSVLSELGFRVDASANVRYDEYLPRSIRRQTGPFEHDGLVELPTSYSGLSLLSRCALRGLLARPVTATAATLRADAWGCSGLQAARQVLAAVDIASFYMHPFDVTDYHDLENDGTTFRSRFESLVKEFETVAIDAAGVEAEVI